MIATATETQQRELGIEFLAQLLSRIDKQRCRLFSLEVRTPMGEGRIDLDLS